MKKVINENTLKSIIKESLKNYLKESMDSELGVGEESEGWTPEIDDMWDEFGNNNVHDTDGAFGVLAQGDDDDHISRVAKSLRSTKFDTDANMGEFEDEADEFASDDNAEYLRNKMFESIVRKSVNETFSKRTNAGKTIKLTENNLKSIISESVQRSINEISWNTQRNAYNKMLVPNEQFPGTDLKRGTARSQSMLDKSLRTVFENDGYKITQDIFHISVYSKPKVKEYERGYREEFRNVFSIENGCWTQPTENPPVGSPNDQDWVETVSVLCNLIQKRTQEYGITTEYAKQDVYFDETLDAKMQSRRDMEDFQNVRPSFGDDWRMTNTQRKELVANNAGTVAQDWPYLRVNTTSRGSTTDSNYSYNYNDDMWYGHSGQEGIYPQLENYNAETIKLMRAVVNQIAKYRKLKGLEPSKWQNINLYF